MAKFKVGDKVKAVQASRGWGRVKKGDIGVITRVNTDGSEYKVDFTNQKGWDATDSDLKIYVPKPTKNQRITALENEVKRLDKFSEGLRGELTGALKRIESLEAKLVEKVAVVEKSANEQRAEMIEKAKAFVKKYQAVRAGESSHSKGNHTCRNHFYETEFVVKGNKVTALVRWLTWGEEVQEEIQHVGRAYCSPTDVFNEWIGKAIALGRALGLDVSEFEQAVQPTVAVGQLIEVCFLDNEPTGRFLAVSGIDTNGYPTHDNGTYTSHYKIINDTNAQYGGGE